MEERPSVTAVSVLTDTGHNPVSQFNSRMLNLQHASQPFQYNSPLEHVPVQPRHHRPHGGGHHHPGPLLDVLQDLLLEIQ